MQCTNTASLDLSERGPLELSVDAVHYERCLNVLLNLSQVQCSRRAVLTRRAESAAFGISTNNASR
jgi:hypothetical protein